LIKSVLLAAVGEWEITGLQRRISRIQGCFFGVMWRFRSCIHLEAHT